MQDGVTIKKMTISGHIRKSRFNNKKNVCKQFTSQKEISEYATHGKLKLFLLEGRGLTTHTHTNQRKRKGGLPFRVVPAGPPVRAVSQQNGARFAAAHTKPFEQLLEPPVFHPLQTDSRSRSASTHASQHERLAARLLCSAYRPLLSSTRTFPTSAFPHVLSGLRLALFSLVPRPFWACLRPLGQSGQPTRLLPVNVTGGGVPTALLCGLSRPSDRQPFHDPGAAFSCAMVFRREIAPRPCRASIPLPLGDRVHTVPSVVVCGEGGGVVASSMMLCGVCWRGV